VPEVVSLGKAFQRLELVEDEAGGKLFLGTGERSSGGHITTFILFAQTWLVAIRASNCRMNSLLVPHHVRADLSEMSKMSKAGEENSHYNGELVQYPHAF